MNKAMNLKDKIFNKNFLANAGLVSFGVLVAGLLMSFMFRMVISPPVDASLSENEQVGFEKVIQVSVLNACGESGIASKARNYLRKRGFDVVEIGNYESKLDSSIVFDRLGDAKSSTKTAYAMGIHDKNIVQDLDSSLFLRCTIVLGKDFKTLNPFN
jgi:LytR cell envelope-related transcriptional attenuator